MVEGNQKLIHILQQAALYFESDALTQQQYTKYRKIQKEDIPAVTTIIKHFGKWSVALMQAGLQTAHPSFYRCSLCGKRYERQNREVYCSECLAKKGNQQLIQTKEGSYPDDALISALQFAAKQTVAPLTIQTYQQIAQSQYPKPFPSYATICSRYGSWIAALKVAHVYEDYHAKSTRHFRYTDAELIECLQQAKQQIAGRLTIQAFDQICQHPSSTLIRQRFGGSWIKALRAAHIEN